MATKQRKDDMYTVLIHVCSIEMITYIVQTVMTVVYTIFITEYDWNMCGKIM